MAGTFYLPPAVHKVLNFPASFPTHALLCVFICSFHNWAFILLVFLPNGQFIFSIEKNFQCPLLLSAMGGDEHPTNDSLENTMYCDNHSLCRSERIFPDLRFQKIFSLLIENLQVAAVSIFANEKLLPFRKRDLLQE
jgi:hypothetical protein